MILKINGKDIEVSNDDLAKAIENKVETFDIKADFTIRTATEDNTFKTNIQKEAHSTGIEIGRKNVLKGIVIDTVGGVHKNDDTSISAVNSLITSKVNSTLEGANVEPNEKIKGLNSDIDILKSTISGLQNDNATSKNEFTAFKKNIRITEALSNAIPDGTLLPKNDMLNLVKGDIKLDVNENNQVFVVGQDGNPLKNSIDASLKSVTDHVKGYFDDRPQYMKTAQGGGAGTDSQNKGDKQDLDSFIKEMGDLGHSPNSEDFNREVDVRVKAGLLDI